MGLKIIGCLTIFVENDVKVLYQIVTKKIKVYKKSVEFSVQF